MSNELCHACDHPGLEHLVQETDFKDQSYSAQETDFKDPSWSVIYSKRVKSKELEVIFLSNQ